MNILIVSSYLPYPLHSGGHVRLYNLLKYLAKNHALTLVCEIRDFQTDKDVDALKKFCKQVVTIPRKKQWSIKNIVKTGVSKDPFLVTGHVSLEMKKKIESLLQNESFDVIHAETFYIFQNIPKTKVPIIVVEHNIEYLVYKRYAMRAPAILKPFFNIDVKKMQRVEEKVWESATKLIAVSEEEKKYMKRSDVVVIPNGVDTQYFKFQDSNLKIGTQEKKILFIGDFKWIQNRDAATWIITDIWPKLNQELGIRNRELKLWVVGKHIPGSIKNLTSDSNIFFDENAPEETSEIFKKAYLLLAPIRIGGGTSFKILEAMASGVPVLTTGLGAEGIGGIDEKDVLISETTEQMVESVNKLIKDKDFYTKIAKNARALIQKNYDWEAIGNKLEAVYQSVKE